MKIFFLMYNALLYLLTPFILCRLKWKSRQNHAYFERLPERFGFYARKEAQLSHDIWIHAVSFGEVEVAQPLIRHWCKKGKHVLVTTTTPTGSKRVTDLFSDEVTHVYLPFEWPGAIKRFLTVFHPKCLLIIETELWPNLLSVCAAKKMPIMITNARLSERSMKGYAYLSYLMKHVLSHVSLVLAQSKSDGERFIQLGLAPTRLVVSGNLKFDAKTKYYDSKELNALKATLFNQQKVLIAASTHPGEEPLIINAFMRLKVAHPALVLVIAPRHPERRGEILKALKDHELTAVCRTQNKGLGSNESTFILDTLGELQLFYHLSDIAFVGGSLVPHGGHNVLEPIRANLPVLVGPYMHNFNFMTQALLKIKGIVQVKNEIELEIQINQLLLSEEASNLLTSKASHFLIQHQGALQKNIDIIEGYLEQDVFLKT